MTDTVFRKLQEHLNKLPMGFPATESGSDIKLLKKMYEPEEAELALELSTLPATAADIAGKNGGNTEEIEAALKRMGKRGLLITTTIDNTTNFILAPYIVGTFEYQLNRLDREYIELHNTYMMEAMAFEVFGGKTSLFRIVPVEKSVESAQEILPHEKVREMIMKADNIAVSDCLCRLKAIEEGRGCDHPVRTCLTLNRCADFYIENDLRAERITKDEALAIMDESEKQGLVVHTQNSSGDVDYICNCCKCSCGIMSTIVHFGMHSQLTRASYQCRIDSDLCNGCGTCLDRCIFKAVNLENGVAEINLKNCMGCGLCVSTCPTGAASLEKRPPERQPDVPSSVQEMYDRIQQEKGRPERFYSFSEIETAGKIQN